MLHECVEQSGLRREQEPMTTMKSRNTTGPPLDNNRLRHSIPQHNIADYIGPDLVGMMNVWESAL